MSNSGVSTPDKYKISVLIPFYRADDFFDQCFESIVRQTHKPDEIIIVNDASGEASERYLEKFEDKATVIHLASSHGAAGARNIAVSKAQYEWLAFQDADDYWELDKLEKQIAAMEKHADWIGCHTGVRTFNNNGPQNEYVDKPSPLQITDLLMGSHVTPPSLLIKKSVVEEVGGFDTNFKTSSDYEFSIRLAKSGNLLGFISEPLINVRRADHGNVSSKGFRVFSNHVRLVKKHRDVFVGIGGLGGTRRFLAKSLMESGRKIGGNRGRLVSIVGRALSF